MYHEHFKLKLQPFSEHAAVRSLWIDQRMKEALARLTFLVDHAGLGLVTGPSGVGKSALLKCFLDSSRRGSERPKTVAAIRDQSFCMGSR